ncbi:MAG: hypothetical protein NWR72_21620 [Bacteroidia bacterium]|nr:hypothetical protein [Bacteroidia bacterium]
MSNLSDIGFPVQTEEEFAILLEQAYESGHHLDTESGFYVRYADLSGAELWLQFDHERELIGMNPHFRGSSRVKVGLVSPVLRPQSQLDGAWFAWANPIDPTDPESGDFPFVFDTPDFLLQQGVEYPGEYTFQLTAFSQEIAYYETEEEFADAQAMEEIPFAPQSFIPVGLFGEEKNESPDAFALLTGKVLAAEKRKNQLSGQWFLWTKLSTLGVVIDLVVDPLDLDVSPQAGGIIQCQAWLSGQVVKE